MIRCRLFVVALAAICAAGLSARGDVFDAAKDFSTSANPNGVWTYGYETTLGGPLTLNSTSGASLAGTGLEYWQTNIASNDPLLAYNATSSVINYTSVVVQPGQLFFHPGPQDQYETVRFVAPKAETLQLSALFTGIDTTGTTTDVHILLNGTSLFSGLINGYGSTQTYSNLLTFAAGDKLDVSVGYGSNGTYFNDSTALSVLLSSPVPEPGGLVLLGFASTFLVAIRGPIRRGFGGRRDRP